MSMTTVAQILSAKPNKNTFTIAPDASVFDALRLMAHRNVGALVVTAGDTVVGMVTERDYARKVVLLDRASRETAVHEIMTSPVMYVRLSQSVEECMALMTDKRLRHLPVIDGGRLRSRLVSIGDLVKQVIADQKFIIEQLEHFISGQRLRCSSTDEWPGRNRSMGWSVRCVSARSARISAKMLANLKPCPEHADAMVICGCAGWGPSRKCPSGERV